MPLQVTFTLDGAGRQTMPPLPKNLPRVLGTPVQTEIMYDVPSTPKTAPGPFHPTTPSKSRPAKTPVTVAAFRKRRSQLAASAFQECAPALLLSNPNMSSMRLTQAVGGLTLLPQRQCMSGIVSAEACRLELEYEKRLLKRNSFSSLRTLSSHAPRYAVAKSCLLMKCASLCVCCLYLNDSGHHEQGHSRRLNMCASLCVCRLYLNDSGHHEQVQLQSVQRTAAS